LFESLNKVLEPLGSGTFFMGAIVMR
jgi:hypothetical protein